MERGDRNGGGQPARRFTGLFAVLLVAALAGCGSDSSSDGSAASARSPIVCGDGRVQVGEQCDGGDFAGRSCASFGRGVDGVLGCYSDCSLDLSGCRNATCGNDRIDGLSSPFYGLCEQCDGTALGGATCEGFGGSGTLRCGADCRPDRASCDDLCWNGRLDPGEACDFDPWGWGPLVPDGVSCASLGLGDGMLQCGWSGGSVLTPYGTVIYSACQLQAGGCERGADAGFCGDGLRRDGEECDGADLGGATCEGLGLTGTLRCDTRCRLDFAECVLPPGPAVCGNGVVEVGEDCDGARFAPLGDDPGFERSNCLSNALHYSGVAPCRDCRFDQSLCFRWTEGTCGDGVAQRYEQCDGDDLRGVTCADLGGSGSLRCTPWCTLDPIACDDVAGNGRREGGEPCDFTFAGSVDHGGETCASLGYGSGTLGCGLMSRSRNWTPELFPASDPYFLTRFQTYECERPGTCGDGRATDGEDCDGDDLAGATCATFDAEGALRCTEWCGFDLSGCRSTARCGDGRIDFGEMCEPNAMRSTCAADGGSGAYVCDPEFCVLDQTGCAFTCLGGD